MHPLTKSSVLAAPAGSRARRILEEEDVEQEFTHGRAFQVRHHLSRRSIQLRAQRSHSLDR
jgi:hypothetical protein